MTAYFQKPVNSIAAQAPGYLLSSLLGDTVLPPAGPNPANFPLRQGYKYTARVNFEVTVFEYQLKLTLNPVVPMKTFYYVDEPVSMNSVVTLQRRSSSGAIISERILPFLPDQDPVKEFAILDIKWKIFSTLSPENS